MSVVSHLTESSEALVYKNGKRLALGAPTTAVSFIGQYAAFALGDGAVAFVTPDGDKTVFAAHDGAILAAAAHPDGKRLVTGGDDGVLRAIAPDGRLDTLAEFGGRWIDHVVTSAASGAIVAAVGKDAVVLSGDKEQHRFTYPSTLGGLALGAKGRKLAVSHYGGAHLRYALIENDPGTAFAWKGSHLAVTVSPEADYVFTSMQDNDLHGWRAADKFDLRMTGYTAKTRSFAWDRRGRWMATSGANCAVIWPFQGKTGPLDKEPAMVGERAPLATRVAFHPREDILAIGYADGEVLVARLGETPTKLDEPGEGAVSALAWSADGGLIAWADEAGRGAVMRYSG